VSLISILVKAVMVEECMVQAESTLARE
jgi:hypothetical protein